MVPDFMLQPIGPTQHRACVNVNVAFQMKTRRHVVSMQPVLVTPCLITRHFLVTVTVTTSKDLTSTSAPPCVTTLLSVSGSPTS